ncbi:hypothetical protein BDD12DRAFT_725232 [Trichophaea hybrida]|nr:hypothetical protein BDD12DRAFT_725232 [Trichophaea hybrida]
MAVSTAILPAVTALYDCTDFSQTVSPYLHQLSSAHILPLLRGEVSPTTWYLSTNPLMSALLFSLAMSVTVFVSSQVNRNPSQVDRLWSILPVVYIGHFAVWARLSGLETERLDMLATFAGLWGLRLTYNYWRKGGYEIGSQDYRWEIVKSRMSPLGFVVLDLTFIAFYQNLLLLAVSTPAYILLLCSTLKDFPAMNTTDTVISRALIVLLLIETLADQQQWVYQSAKKAYKETGNIPEGFTKEDLNRGFVVSGLWSICRHPNFTCEQAIWLGVYQWGCWQTDTLYNWTGLGAMGYLAVFQGSTILTEEITAGKYREYKEYQKLVNKFVPRWSVFKSAKAEEKKE